MENTRDGALRAACGNQSDRRDGSADRSRMRGLWPPTCPSKKGDHPRGGDPLLEREGRSTRCSADVPAFDISVVQCGEMLAYSTERWRPPRLYAGFQWTSICGPCALAARPADPSRPAGSRRPAEALLASRAWAEILGCENAGDLNGISRSSPSGIHPRQRGAARAVDQPDRANF